MQRFCLIPALFLAVQTATAAPDEGAAKKEALQKLNEFIGKWEGTGGPPVGVRPKPDDLWKETLNWGWKFGKDGDARLVFSVEEGKHFKSGELRYLPEDDVYELTVTDAEGNDRKFTGELSRGRLTLTHQDEDSQDNHRLTMSTNNRGARFVYDYAVQPKGRGIFKRQYQVSHTKEGESLAAGGNKKECVVTGGLGTMAVSYKGKTYYVCCSGCAEAFRDDPEKIIAEYEARKK